MKVTLRPLLAEATRAGLRALVEIERTYADVWKIEGLDRRVDCERIVTAARRNGRNSVGCIILGRGEDETRACEWLTITATVPGFIGFVVGRTSFWEPSVNWRSNKISRARAVDEIAGRYREFVKIFETQKETVPA